MTEKYYPSMVKTSCCKEGEPCDYHKNKIDYRNFTDLIDPDDKHHGSANPPKEVWGKEYIDKIDKTISATKNNSEYKNLNTINKIKSILEKVNSFWQESDNSEALNGKLHENWAKWSEDVKDKKKYAAGGWKASPEQLSQIIEVLKVLREENVNVEEYFRIGTASGKHTQQEIFAMAKSGIKKPELTIIDSCKPPLTESKALAKNPVKETILGSALELPEEMNEKYSIATTHFIDSFLPTKDMFDDLKMTHQEALELKENHFKNVYRVLKNDGFFITAVGIDENGERRINNVEELKKCLENAGFNEKNIVITETTDPYDYDNNNKKLQKGNYFIVTQK